MALDRDATLKKAEKHIAERLSGQAPFMTHDPFSDGPEPATDPAPTPAEAPNRADAAIAGTAVSDDPSISLGRGQDERAAPAPSPHAASGTSGDEIDLTGVLGALDPGHERAGADDARTDTAPYGDAPRTLDQVFAQIRTDAGTDQDFSQQHMTLARTYLEIGMLDEAITSLETAVRSPRQRFEAAAALGRVHHQRGDHTRAIEWLERAAEVAASTGDEGRELLYDLGVLLNEREASRALAVFLELQADAGDYRDVPSRIDRLARVQTGG